MGEITTLQVSVKTKEKIRKLGEKDESYDMILSRVLKRMDKCQREKEIKKNE